MKKLFLILFVFCISGVANSQSASSNSSYYCDDPEASKYNIFYDYTSFGKKPTVELSYGTSAINSPRLTTTISKTGMMELKLGTSSQSPNFRNHNVTRYSFKYLLLSTASSDLNYDRNNQIGLASDMWRFGFGKRTGTGFKFNSFSILPYNSNSYIWSRVNINEASLSSLPQNDITVLSDFNKDFRFGTSNEIGINVKANNLIGIDFKYERSLIFPRHQFGKHMVSLLVEEAGYMLVDGFVHNVMQKTPVGGAIVGFVLKSGYSYGMSQLRTSSMNWPFNTAAPLDYDSFKLGMSFSF
ncbi:MAG TPA: hypothetical protein VHP32_11930 [Ignavibacteria bacterium]|nr:hypothetical protein [Ignavibacteria bacterium]